jgi:hypothetical protein
MAGSSLEIYRDGVRYRYIPVDDYVGFVRGAKARCGERESELLIRPDCPAAKRLCKERKSLEELREELAGGRGALKGLTQWSSALKPNAVEAEKWIASAEKVGRKIAEWQRRASELELSLEGQERRFRRQVSADEPRFLAWRCKEELELSLPAGLVDVRILNEAELGEKELSISRYLGLRNHSGVDLSTKEAHIYARDARRSYRPIRFRPWVVRLQPKTPIKRLMRSAPSTVARMSTEVEAAPVPVVEKLQRLGVQSYTVGKLELPSTGEEIRVAIERYRVPMACEELSYPWRDLTIYRACRFTPKSPIVSDRWILKEGRRILSERAYGAYEEGKYLLYVDRDETVKLRREPLLEKERSSGIFGGRIRRKDGYRLIVDNTSDREKRLKIVERIPRSTTDKIRVKFLGVEGAKREFLDPENGKLVLQVLLAPHEHKVVTGRFELSYDKELKVRY